MAQFNQKMRKTMRNNRNRKTRNNNMRNQRKTMNKIMKQNKSKKRIRRQMRQTLRRLKNNRKTMKGGLVASVGDLSHTFRSTINIFKQDLRDHIVSRLKAEDDSKLDDSKLNAVVTDKDKAEAQKTEVKKFIIDEVNKSADAKVYTTKKKYPIKFTFEDLKIHNIDKGIQTTFREKLTKEVRSDKSLDESIEGLFDINKESIGLWNNYFLKKQLLENAKKALKEATDKKKSNDEIKQATRSKDTAEEKKNSAHAEAKDSLKDHIENKFDAIIDKIKEKPYVKNLVEEAKKEDEKKKQAAAEKQAAAAAEAKRKKQAAAAEKPEGSRSYGLSFLSRGSKHESKKDKVQPLNADDSEFCANITQRLKGRNTTVVAVTEKDDGRFEAEVIKGGEGHVPKPPSQSRPGPPQNQELAGSAPATKPEEGSGLPSGNQQERPSEQPPPNKNAAGLSSATKPEEGSGRTAAASSLENGSNKGRSGPAASSSLQQPSKDVEAAVDREPLENLELDKRTQPLLETAQLISEDFKDIVFNIIKKAKENNTGIDGKFNAVRDQIKTIIQQHISSLKIPADINRAGEEATNQAELIFELAKNAKLEKIKLSDTEDIDLDKDKIKNKILEKAKAAVSPSIPVLNGSQAEEAVNQAADPQGPVAAEGAGQGGPTPPQPAAPATTPGAANQGGPTTTPEAPGQEGE